MLFTAAGLVDPGAPRYPLRPMQPSRAPRVLLLAGALVSSGALEARAQDSGSVPSGSSGAVVKPPADDPPPATGPVVPPRLVKFREAPYPDQARRDGVTGAVVLRLTIGIDGKVSASEVQQGAGHGFDEAAREASLGFEFEPATRGGKPVAVTILYRYEFTLKEAPPEEAPKPTTGNLEGTLRIAGENVAIAGAEVTLDGPDGQRYRLVTDENGRWSLAGVPPGKYRLRASADGYEPYESDEEIVAGEATEVVLRLSPQGSAEGVTVTGDRPPREVTRRTLERREISRIPGTGGDALRSIQSLPGVARPPGLAGLLIVRGSAPQDTNTFVDGAGVPLIYHFGGLSSVIPTELLDQIDFYPGSFGAEYGRVQGGIVDVKLRSPNTRCSGPYGRRADREEFGCYHGLVQADLIDTRFLLEGPLVGEWTFLIAGRRSWFDAWLKPVLEEAGAGVTSAPVYYDGQVLVETKPTSTSRLSFRAFGSSDRLEILIRDPNAQEPGFGGNLTFGTRFWVTQALFEERLAPEVSQRAMVSVGHTSFDLALGALRFDLSFQPVLFRNEFAFKVSDGVTLNTGLDFQAGPFDVFVRAPPPPRPGEPDPGPFTTRPPLETRVSRTAFRPAWYAEGEVTPSRTVRVVPGVRLDYARDSGRADLSPRVNARWNVVSETDGTMTEAEAFAAGRRNLRTTLKGGVGLYHQPPQFQETDDVFGSPGLRSNRAVHYSLGLEQELTRHVEASVEGYYKDLDRQVSRVPSATGAFDYGNEAYGTSMGVETLLKYKPDRRFFGWLAYTLSRSVRSEPPEFRERLFQYDQTHNLTVLGSYRLDRGWEFGARFRVISGSLDTPVVARGLPALYAADAGAYIPLQGRPFSRRLPTFHQLDLRVDKRWQFESWRLSAYLDVQNVYNNPAVETLLYSFDYSQQGYQTGIPIIPSLGVRGEF